MKKILIVMVVILTCLMTACGTEIREAVQTDGVALKVENTVSGLEETRLSFTVSNNGSATWKVGDSVHIEFRKESGEWEEVPINTSFTPSTTKLQPNASLTQVDYCIEQALDKGDYRLTVYLENTRSGEAVTLKTEFRID